jgi:hypothetical protein
MGYQRDDAMAPDTDFEPGRLEHLVVGNDARLLDARRTPLRVTAVRPPIAVFTVEVMAFEDAGATWDLPLEDVARMQFALGSPRAPTDEVAAYEAAIARHAGELVVDADDATRAATAVRLAAEQRRAAAWLDGGASAWGRGERRIEPAAATGDVVLIADLGAYLAGRGLDDVERAVTTAYVSNAEAGDTVRAHAVVAAELGLAAYRGRRPRDPSALAPPFDRARRADHLLARLGYVSAVFGAAGLTEVVLHRGLSFEHGGSLPRPTATFVSATFSHDIAAAQAAVGPTRRAGALLTQRVPVARLVMTHHETAAMNDRYREAEAVLLGDPAALF